MGGENDDMVGEMRSVVKCNVDKVVVSTLIALLALAKFGISRLRDVYCLLSS